MEIDWKIIKKDGYPEEEKNYLWLISGALSAEPDFMYESLSTARNFNIEMKMGLILDGWTYIAWFDVDTLSDEDKAKLLKEEKIGSYFSDWIINKDLIDNDAANKILKDNCSLSSMLPCD